VLSQYTFFYGLKLTTATFAITFANLTPVITFLISTALRYVFRQSSSSPSLGTRPVIIFFKMDRCFRVESLNLKSTAGSAAKIIGTLMSLGGALLLSLYKGVAVTTHHQQSTAAEAPAASSQVQVLSSKSWMLGTVSLLANCLFFSLWLLLQSRLTNKYPALYSSTAIMFFFSTLQAGALTVTIERHLSVWVVTRRLEILTILYSVRYHACISINTLQFTVLA